MNTSHEPTSRVVACQRGKAIAVCGAAVLALCILSAGLCQAGEKVPSFEDPVFFPTPSCPWGLATADASQNGFPDVAVAQCGMLTIYLNTGDWDEAQDGLVLSQTFVIPSGNTLGELEWAHMNPAVDDSLDLVVADYEGRGVYVFLADGDNPGYFPAPQPSHSYEVSCWVHGLVVADLDNDGYKDVALGATFEQAQPDVDKVITLWNDHDGGLEDEREVPLGLGNYQYPHDLVVGHFSKTTGFALLDLVTANKTLDSISVLTNLGNREFSVETIAMPGECPPEAWEFDTLTAGHFKLGKISPDVAAKEPGQVYGAILHCNSQGGFGHDCEMDRYKLHSGTPYSGGSHNGHLNGGTKLDLAFAMLGTAEVSVLLGKGDATFQAPSEESGYLYSVGDGRLPTDVRIVDLDMDGFGDLLTCSTLSDELSVLINKMEILSIPPAP